MNTETTIRLLTETSATLRQNGEISVATECENLVRRIDAVSACYSASSAEIAREIRSIGDAGAALHKMDLVDIINWCDLSDASYTAIVWADAMVARF